MSFCNGGLRAAVFVAALLPGVGPADPRIGADPAVIPWAAIGRLQIPGASRCTAVMVAAHWAVTAAHCLGVRRLGHLAPASAIHLLLGYRDGAFGRHLVPDLVRVEARAAVDALAPDMAGNRGRDVALLHFAEAVGPTLAPETTALAPGTPLALAGYGQDRAERLAVDPECAVRGYAADARGQPTLLHDCAGTRGTSGGAVLAQAADGRWRLAGVQVAGRLAGPGGEAVPGFVVARLLGAALPMP